MIGINNLREAENASSARKVNKERNVLRSKANALGDVQNTLHFRPNNFVNPTTKSAKKVTIKLPNCKNVSKENALSTINSRVEKFATTTTKELAISASKIDEGIVDMHNHSLCEQAVDSISDFLGQYKFTEHQIVTLARSVKRISLPTTVSVNEPFADIEIPTEKFNEKNFLVSDIFHDLIIPAVPPPVDVV